MSKLYDYLKYNVLKINTKYINGININLSKNVWTPVFSGSVSLDGQGLNEQAKDFVIGENYYIEIRQSIMSSVSNSMSSLIGKYGGKVATPTVVNLELIKDTPYKLSVENAKINFGETFIGSFVQSYGTDSFGNPPGPTITIKGQDQSNIANIGICTATLTSTNQHMDYSQPVATTITDNTYVINSVQVQPSQRSGNSSNPYLKISYKENVIEIVDDSFFSDEKIDFNYDVYFDKKNQLSATKLKALNAAVSNLVNKFKAQGTPTFDKVTFKEIGDYSGHFTFSDANLSRLIMISFTKFELMFEHVDGFNNPMPVVLSLSNSGSADIGAPVNPNYAKFFPVMSALRSSFPAFLFSNRNDFVIDAGKAF